MIHNNLYDYLAMSILANTVVFTVTSYFLFVRFRAPLYHVGSVYQIYHFFGFILRPCEIYLNGVSQLWSYTGIEPEPIDIIWMTVVVNAAHISFTAGFISVFGQRGFIPLLPPVNLSARYPKRFVTTAAILLALGGYGTSRLAGDVFSDQAVISWGDLAAGGNSGNVSGYETMLAEFIPITLLALFSVRSTRRIAAAAIIAFIAFRLFLGSGRSTFVVVLIGLLCISLMNNRRRFPSGRAIIAGLAFLVLFNVVGSNRVGIRNVISGDLSISELFGSYGELRGAVEITADMKEYDVLSNILQIVPERSGFTYGSQYLRLLIWPIPRQLWPDKPYETSSVNLMEYGNFFALTYSLYGDSYMTCGIFGMILILFAISRYLNIVYEHAATSTSAFLLFFYLIQTIYATIIFRDGPVSALYFILCASMGAWALCHFGKLFYLNQEPASISWRSADAKAVAGR